MPTSIILVADTHIGHRVGLAPPSVTVGDGWQAKPPMYSRKVWKYFVECCGEAKEFTKGTKRLLFLVGDTIDCDIKRRSNQYITNSKSEVLEVAVDALAPLYEWVDNVIVLRGTDAHTGKDGELEEMFAADLDHAIPDKITGNASWQYFAMSVDGYRLDAAHHTTMGGRAWTFANAANFLAADTMMEYTLRSDKPPQMVVRAHVHRAADSFDNYDTRAVILPCWKLLDTYGIKRKPTRAPHIGMMAFVIEGGEIVREKKWIEKMSQFPQRTWSRQLKMS